MQPMKTMSKHEVKTWLEQMELRPSRRLGQNFLFDHNLLSAIIRDFDPRPGQEVLEIGPGSGTLTERLLAAGCRVTAVEIDHRLCAWLRHKFADAVNFRLVENDACKVDYDREFGALPYRCLANLPYAISSPWLVRMTEQENRPQDLAVLVQRELADRLTARPRTKEYGSLTLAVGLFYTVEQTRKVPPNVFFPQPEVDSACLRLQPSPWAATVSRLTRQHFSNLLRVGFSQRRKQLLKLLTARFPAAAANLRQCLQTRGFNATARAEELTIEDFLALAAALAPD